MNLALILKLITQLGALMESKPGSKGRAKNFSQAALLGICSTILFYSAGTPEKLASLDKRLAVIEHELKIAVATSSSTNAVPDVATWPNVNDQATAATAGSRPAFTFTRKGDL